MADHKIRSLAPELAIPDALSSFKSLPQAIWTGSQWRHKGTFTPGYGNRDVYTRDLDWTIARQDSMYQAAQATGLKLQSDAGKAYGSNIEMYGDGRWMPASVYNGIGFEVYQSSSHNNAIFLQKFALVFASKTGSGYRIYGGPYVGSGTANTYKYITFKSSTSINEIRGWGADWLFQGIILHARTGSGSGNVVSHMDVYNMRVGHKYNNSTGCRITPVKTRSYGNRNATTGNQGVSDPFTTN